MHGEFVPITEISGYLGGWRELSLVRQIEQSLKDCIIPLVIIPEVSSHLAVVQYMQEALPLPTKRAGSFALLLPQL